MFVTTAFLECFSGGLAFNIAMTVRMATRPGSAPFYTYSAAAAHPMAAVVSSAHYFCATTLVTDEDSLEEMLEAIHKQFDVVNEYNGADKEHALETLEHVFSLASQSARETLKEVQAGFPTSGGDFPAWKHALTWRGHRKDAEAARA